MEDPDPQFLDQQREIFLKALKLAQSKRGAFLDRECGNDLKLRLAVEELLAHHIDDSFLAKPAIVSPATLSVEQAGEHIGRYLLMEEIGRGGMGVVYRAQQVEPVRRDVALKVIKAGMDTAEVIARFEMERQALAMMDHSNIARILDAGATNSGRPYFVMELVKGVPVTRFCEERGASMRDRLELFAIICGAVQHAHQKGVIHRDLKPNNILVATQDEAFIPKIIDFGIAKATQGNLTERTQLTHLHPLIGTPAYMSPEQANLEGSEANVDTRTDVYALGVLLYELLTGTTPFEAGQLKEAGQDAVFRVIREHEPPKPSTRLTELRKRSQRQAARHLSHTDLKRDLDWIVLKALEKERERRYQTANAFGLDVRRFLASEPVDAVAPSRVYRMRKFVRRNRGATAAAAAIVGALVIGLGLALRSTIKEGEARTLAEIQRSRAEDQRYASDMKVALASADSYHLPLLGTLLERHVPEAGQFDRRGWLWQYLKGQTRQQFRSVELGGGGSIALAASSDGDWIAHSAVRDHRYIIEILNAETLQVVQTIDHPGQHLAGMTFSLDGRSLTVEPAKNAPALRYDLQTGTAAELSSGVGWKQRLTPDSRLVLKLENLGPGENGLHELCIRDARKPGRVLAKTEPFDMPTPFGMENKFRLSPDGTLAALACLDPVQKIPLVKLFSIPKLEEAGVIETSGTVAAIAFSPDSQLLATGYDYPSQVDLWSVRETDLIVTMSGKMRSPCAVLTFSPDGRSLASTELSGLIQIWQVPDGELRRRYTGDPGYATFSADSARFLTAHDGDLKIWDATSRSQTDLKRLSSEGQLWNLAYSPDATMLAAAAADSVVRLFDSQSEKLLFELGRPRRAMDLPPVGNPDSRLRFSQDGSLLAAVNPDSTASIYNLGTRAGVDIAVGAQVEELSLSPDGKWLVTVGNQPGAIFWDTATGEERFRHEERLNWFTGVAFSPDFGRRVLAYGYGQWIGNVVLLDLETRQPLVKAKTASRIHSLTFSPDGKVLACGLLQAVELRDARTLELLDTIEGAQGPVPNVSFSADGTALAIPCWGGFVQVWNRRVKAEVGRLNPSGRDSQWLISAKFSPSGGDLAVSVRDFGIQIYRTPDL